MFSSGVRLTEHAARMGQRHFNENDTMLYASVRPSVRQSENV